MNKIDRIDQPIKQLTNGDWLNLSLFRIQGSEEGPHVHIQASVHGAELQGNPVIYYLMEHFMNNEFKGSITFIPTANPHGLNQKMGTYTYGRFNPITGDNWNRCYEDILTRSEEEIGFSLKKFVEENKDETWENIKSKFKTSLFSCFKNYESHLADYGSNENKSLFILLQKVASTADIVLDLHTGPLAARYLYSAKYQVESAKHMNFPFVLNIPSEFAGAMDEGSFIPWVRLQNAFKDIGKEVPLEFQSYTVELGSEERISFSEAQKDAHNILNYLHHRHVIDEKPIIDPIVQRHNDVKDFKTYYAPMSGLYEYLKGPGDFVATGEVFAKVLNFKNLKSDSDLDNVVTELKCNKDCYIINQCPSAAVSQGMELFQIMEEFHDESLD